MSSALFSKQNLLCRLAEQQDCRKLSMCDCVHTQKMSLTTLIQNRGCRRFIHVPVPSIQQAANSELAEQQYSTTLSLCDCLHTKGVVVKH